MVNTWFQPSWVIGTGGSVDRFIAPLQRALAVVDPNLPFGLLLYERPDGKDACDAGN
jgi:hypothetical protein